MYVGFVVYGGLDRTSGGYRYDRKLVENLRAHGDEVDVVAIPQRTYPRHLADGVSRTLRSRLNRPYDVLVQDELCHASLWRHNPHLDRPGAIVSVVHLLRSGPSAGVWSPLYRSVERRYLDSVGAAVCTSRDTRDRTERLADVPTQVAPPAGRVEGAALASDEVASRARDGRLRVAFVGNLQPRKGVKPLLDAFSRIVNERRRSATLTVVGSRDADPAHARSAVERATELDVDGCVTFAGRVSSDELRRVLRRSHVLAVPAAYEGFGMVYLEAMEYGVVPIASAVGGAREIVDDGQNGFLVEPGDADALADRLARLDADRDELARLGANALRTADDHPTWAETTARVRSFLRAQADGSDDSHERASRSGTYSAAEPGDPP
ncbi:glycosyltransferase family 4 protein [Halovivax gelatinilyticus]|uniref:glycosyltransferase family 4 protein n=1 Tax=Halovivax gelatinilyticus TaxID=2961597 RepID=UPI0020CA766C|nr:glycosyltransferase family 4 protein [Halovivax gelatinilyticus]